jgi:hypothetical protein
VADTFLGNLAGVVVQVVEGAEDVRVVTDEVVGELVDQREVLPAAAGRGRIGNIWEGALEEHPSQAHSSEVGTSSSGLTRMPMACRKLRGSWASAARWQQLPCSEAIST